MLTPASPALVQAGLSLPSCSPHRHTNEDELQLRELVFSEFLGGCRLQTVNEAGITNLYGASYVAAVLFPSSSKTFHSQIPEI